jgi:TolB-like protein
MQTPDGCRSLFALKGKASTAQQVAADLGVDYVLDSSVRRRDGSLRISAQLVDARSGFQRWAERYDRPAVEAFAVQAEVTSRRIRSSWPRSDSTTGDGDRNRLAMRSRAGRGS